MNYTNKNSVSDMIVRSIENGRWYGGEGEKRDYSVTELLLPPKIYHLMKRHRNELEVDISESIYMLLGSAVHLVIERANLSSASQKIMSRMRRFISDVELTNNPSEQEIRNLLNSLVFESVDGKDIINLAMELNQCDDIIEKRFSYTTQTGKLITGGIDHYSIKNRCITDFKHSSIWTWIYRNRPGSRTEEWTQQLNMYRLFMEKHGYPVDKLCINLIMRDYSKSKSRQDAGYPEPVETIELPLLGLDVVEQMIENRVAELEKYALTLDDAIPACNSHDRWQQQDMYAVYKTGNKTASKLEYSYSGAKSWMEAEISKMAEKDIAKGMDVAVAMKRASDIFSIVKRDGVPTRCIDYCAANKFCDFYRNLPDKVKQND